MYNKGKIVTVVSGVREEVGAAFVKEEPSELRHGGSIGVTEAKEKGKYCRESDSGCCMGG